MNKNDALHSSSKIQQVPIGTLKFDRSYQREPSMPMVDAIADDWNVVASELILVSNRGERPEGSEIEGGMWVVNGQHRTYAARKLGHQKIWARVIDLTDVEDPAKVEAQFRLQTNVRLGDRPLERFKAQLRAGDEDSLMIVKILARFDAEINQTPMMDSGINAVSTVESLYQVDQGALLTETLEVLRDAFKTVGGRHATAPLMKGVAWFIEQHATDADRGRLVDRLTVLGVAALDNRARAHQAAMGGALWMNYYRALVEFYNENLRERNRLEWRLRGAARLAKKSKITGEKAWDK